MIKKIICLICTSFCLVVSSSFAISVSENSTLFSKANLNSSDTDVKNTPKKVDMLLSKSVCIKKEKICYLVNSKGIAKVNSTSSSYIDNAYFSQASVKPTVIYANNSSKLYIGTDKGIYVGTKKLDGNYLFEHMNAFGLDDISRLYVDPQENIFAGTHGNGLLIGKKEQSTSNYIISNHLPSLYIQYIHASSNTVYAGANSQNSEESTFLWIQENGKEYSISLNSEVLINSIDDSNGILKIGTNHGLLIGKKDQKGFYTTLTSENLDAAVYITKKGMIAQKNQGLFKIKEENGHYKITDPLNIHTLMPTHSSKNENNHAGNEYFNSENVKEAAIDVVFGVGTIVVLGVVICALSQISVGEALCLCCAVEAFS